MSTRRAVTLRLPEEDFALLASAARSAGVRPGTLARMILHRSLRQTKPEPTKLLDELRRLREDLPEVDTVAVVRAAREELTARGSE